MKLNVLGRIFTIPVFGALTLAMATPVFATDPSGWYLGGNIGQSQANIAEGEVVEDLLEQGLTTTAFTTDDTDFGYKFLVGYRLTRYFSIEGGYFDLGKFSYVATTDPEGSKTGELGFNGWNIDLLGMLPVFERSALFARIGAHRGKAKVAYTDSGAVVTPESGASNTDTDYKFGIGYQHGFTEALAMRFEIERYRIDDAVGNKGDLDLVSLGVVYHFGTQSRDAEQAEETASQSAASDLIVVPLPVTTERYCSILDIQFEIAQHEIQQEEWERLAVLARFLNRYPDTSAVIEGHSDSVGNAERNKVLSQRRADSVVDYFVNEHQIRRSRLKAIGFGETRPLESNRTEEGKRANRRIGAVIGCANDIVGLEPVPARMTLALHIEFDTDDAKVKPEYHDDLRKVAGFLVANPGINAAMEGHADNASAESAQRISQQRAQSVATYLEEKFGVEGSRLTVRGYGATRRFAYNTSAEGRQENRRVNIILDYQD
jgi:OmpA-OmpF porin, OOP family